MSPPAFPEEELAAEKIIDYYTTDQIVKYPPCKKCGASHKMVVKNSKTGSIAPMDVCYNCLCIGTHHPIQEEIHLD